VLKSHSGFPERKERMMSETITFDYYDGNGDEQSASITLTLGAPDGNDDGGYVVTSISGTIDGQTITGLNDSFETLFGQAPDNKFFPNTTPLVDSHGLSFNTADGEQWNLCNNYGLYTLTNDDDGNIVGSRAFDVSSSGSVPCFAAGTRIFTANGEVPVESLNIGDLVITASGAPRPIKWLGHRSLRLENTPNPLEIQPIRIAAHAFAKNRPHTDLLVSPKHAICVTCIEDVLIEARKLINGTSIRQLNLPNVTYWHIELETHDIILANGLPAESYLEWDNRRFFALSKIVTLAGQPDDNCPTEADMCRPLIQKGATLDFVRYHLANRAHFLAQLTKSEDCVSLAEASAS
jgi:hypothetical protein